MIALRKASGLVEQAGIYLRKATGLVQQEVYLRTAAGLKLIHTPVSPLVLGISGDAYGAGASNSTISVTTSVVTVTVSGGQAPYTYSWARLDGPDPYWNILAPTSAATAFIRGSVGPGDTEAATYACTVTDALGNTETTITVTASVANYGGLGGPLP